MVIPDLDDTTIRAIAIQAASMCEPSSPLELIAWADMIQEFIDPMDDSEEYPKTKITLTAQPKGSGKRG
jgi:hypothetical protein